MRPRSKLVWKLSAVVATILTVVIATSGYVHNLICAHYSLASARVFLRSDTESIVQDVGQCMVDSGSRGVKEMADEIARSGTADRKVRLVSHHSGEVIACRVGDDAETMELKDRPCAACHDREDRGGLPPETIDTLIDSSDGSRVLSVMAPIINQPNCRTAACHQHEEGPQILGFVNTDYSLQQMDAGVVQRRVHILLTILGSVALGLIALWFMFGMLLERPISDLIAGTKRIAAHHLDFRFDRKRTDEFGDLEESFNAMTAKIQSSQDELRDAKEYLESMVENSADIIISVNMEGLIETFNRGAEEALGYDRKEVVGERIESLFVDPRERHAAAELLKRAGNVKNYETRLLAKDGQIRHVLLTLSPLRDMAGSSLGTIGISKDITQEKEFQRELVQSQKFVAIGQAVTGIQHAIKNMLNALKGGAYLVHVGMAKDNRERIEEGWAMIEEGIERISSLSHNMLNFAREWKPDLQDVDLEDLVESVCELNRHTASKNGVELRHEPAEGLPLVRCDPKLIHMATTDIVVNAIDACAWKQYRGEERPEIVIENSLANGGDSYVIQIRDNGCGMAETIRQNIFTPFFSTKKTLGTGLGLALTARIIRVHGGEISVESEPDRGTTFRIHIPKDGPRES